MLQTQTVESGTLSILKKLMELPELQSFNLVGGTALALKYGHRTSIDLDLFSVENFEHQVVIEALRRTFGNSFIYDGDFSKWGIFCFIDDIKLDLVYYPHPMLYPFELWDTIRPRFDCYENSSNFRKRKKERFLGYCRVIGIL